MRSAGDRRRWVVRALAVIVLAGIVAGVAAVVLSTRGDAAERRSASNPAVPAAAFLAAWHAGDYAAMYALVAPGVRASTTYHRFAHEYRAAARTAGMTGLRPAGRLRATASHATVPVSIGTSVFGRIGGSLEIPLVLVHKIYRVAWTPALTFPGLRPGETLTRRVHAPDDRGRILARDGTVLAEGPPGSRTYPEGTAFALVTGFTKSPEGPAIAARHKLGWPAGTEVRPGGPRGVARPDPGRPSPRAAGGGPFGPREPGPDPGPKAGAEAEGRRDDHRPRHPGSVGHGAREPAMAGSSCSTRARARCGRTPGSAWTSPSRRDRRSRP